MADIFGVRVDELPSERRLRTTCEAFMAGERACLVFTPNPEILLRAREDRSYAEVLNAADLALPDGTGVALIRSLRAGRRVRRWPGVEIGATLLQLAAERHAAVAFFGGSDGVAEEAARVWRRRLPGLRIEVVGTGLSVEEDGRLRSAEREPQLLERIRAAAPTIVLVGLGAPKQERWIVRHAADFPSARVMMGVGGAFDMWAGRLPRAPGLLHRLGLEWAWRLALEPHRLRRITRATLVFPFLALTDRSS
ncbi:MAG TPA: WecB/TagA/CpsF family glycosyltransferase [Actinomycetota bacterium]|nr:WecB/TagA/CpsF family glycosyltransferase [Actinomycetota bacterium]